MDVLYFLKERTAFVKQLHERATAPFVELTRRIEAGEEPFVPPYSEDGEPPFLAEWIEAEESKDAVGHACISMLAASLNLYLRTWSDKLSFQCGRHHKNQFKDRGWFNGYRVCFEEALGVNWEQSQTNIQLLEEVALVRNRVQHPESITTVHIQHSRQDYDRLGKRLFFADQARRTEFDGIDGGEFAWIMGPSVKVGADQLMSAISEVEAFCTWLDNEIDKALRQVRRGA